MRRPRRNLTLLLNSPCVSVNLLRLSYQISIIIIITIIIIIKIKSSK